MLEKLTELFLGADKVNTKRYEEFMDFYKHCVLNFPKFLRKRLSEESLSPLVNGQAHKKFDNYKVDFTAKDVVWWEKQFELESPIFRDIEEFKKEVCAAALDVLDDFPDNKDKSFLGEDILKSL